MELMMFIGNDCIDTVTVEQAFIVFPGYVSHFVRLLKMKNEYLLLQVRDEPEFLVQDLLAKSSQQIIQLSTDNLEAESVHKLGLAV